MYKEMNTCETRRERVLGKFSFDVWRMPTISILSLHKSVVFEIVF